MIRIEPTVLQRMDDLPYDQESGVANIIMHIAQTRLHHGLPRVAQQLRPVAALHERRPQQAPMQGQHGRHEDGMRVLHRLRKNGRSGGVIRYRC